MKTIQITYNSKFIIDKSKDGILIITLGCDSPFNYDVILKQMINEYKENDEYINIYLDMLSCVGLNKQRFCCVKYDFSSSNFDFSSLENISDDCLPKSIDRKIKSFYTKNHEQIINNNLLSENEKFSIMQVA